MVLRYNFVLLILCALSALGSSQELDWNGLHILEHQEYCGVFVGVKVINGHEVKLGSRPWMALLRLRNYRGEKLTCGGTLITNRFVLTAAHCVAGLQLVFVRLGEHQISTDPDCRNTGRRSKCAPPVEDINPERIFLHEEYSRFTGHNDIALIKLSRAVEYKTHIKPICLPITDALQQQSDSNENFLVTGWGITENRTGSDVLMEATIQMQDRQTCSLSLSREIKQTQLCVGDTSRDSCKGDSGGPIAYPAEYFSRRRFVQFGIVSYGSWVCGSGYPGVYTKVSSFLPWITRILAVNS